jgi:lipopolysaccharide export system permease protein
LRPVLIAAIGVSLVAAANREVIMPTIRQQLSLDSKNLGGQQEALMQARFDSNYILIGGEKIVPSEQVIKNAKFVLPRHLDRFGKQISAAEARFLPATGKMPSGYLLTGVTQPKGLLKQPSMLDGESKPVIITPPGNDWLKGDQLFVVSGMSFEFLAAGSTWRDFASTREMIRELRNPSTDLGADVRVAIHTRFLQPFMDTTLLFLGLPFVITRTNRNPFVAIGLCLAVVTVFMCVVLGCQSLGTGGWMNPPLAAWLPLIIFGPVAAAMSDTISCSSLCWLAMEYSRSTRTYSAPKIVTRLA